MRGESAVFLWIDVQNIVTKSSKLSLKTLSHFVQKIKIEIKLQS